MSILLLTILFKNIYQQPIIIPLDPDFDEEDFGKNKDKDLDLDKEIEKELGPIKRRNNNVEKEEEMDQPIVETKELRDSNGNNIRITRIHYHRTKNLHGNNMNSESEAITPIQMMRIFDSRVNSIFEDFIRQSIGIKMLLNGLSMIDDDEEENESDKKKTKTNEKISEDFGLEEDENTKNKLEKNDTVKKEKKEKEEKNKKKNKNENKGVSKFEVSKDKIKNNNKGKKKLSRRELIFSRICKYIFYSIIIFTIYILIKKLLEILEIIDPDNAVEIKIENDEESKLKKTSENKQN
jgi:hypothetical protein